MAGAYGHFDDDAREYVITRPDTPLPWINYLGTDDYFGLISNTAGGYSFYRDARQRRLTRHRYNNVPRDVGGRYLYVRDDESGDVWSPSFPPLERYRCRHGLGYTVVEAARRDIEVDTCYFVPIGEAFEVWRARVTNRRAVPAAVSLFSAVEFCLWDAWDDQTNFQRNLNIGEVEVDGNVIFHLTEYRERRNHFAWFGCAEDVVGFDTSRDAFLGAGRGWDRPLVVESGRSADSIAHGWAPIGSHHVTLMLEPGETREVRFGLGYFENPRDAKFVDRRLNGALVRPAIRRALDAHELEAAFGRLGSQWAELLDVLQVSTPNEHVDRMVNTWNAYQCMVTFNLSRSASYFESGIGRGMGFRDCCQDLLGFVQMVPSRARERILDIAATQLDSGGAYHQYAPLTKRGNDAIGSGFNDDPLWLVLAVAAYVKETGDRSILDELVPFDSRQGTERPLLEHLARSVQYTLDRLGPHGLPLIGRADWNDCLNLNCFSHEPGESFQTTENREGGVAESVFIAGLFVLAARELAGITHENRWLDVAAEMSDTVLAHGWDGEWFVRAYDHFGTPVGSSTCEEGQIFIEPQGMCVMAGIGVGDGRAARALESVAERLATQHGIVLLRPAYRRYHPELGEITSYPPGYKENGSVFCHTNPWVIVASTIIGDGERALDYHLRINPSAREAISDVHRSEPYVYAQTIAGVEAPTFGEAKNSWLTGTAAWSYVAVTQWILGIRPDHDGLRIDPCLPAAWEGFTARRRFRDAAYEITVRGSGRVSRLVVDGREVEGNVVPVAAPGSTVVVEAVAQ